MGSFHRRFTGCSLSLSLSLSLVRALSFLAFALSLSRGRVVCRLGRLRNCGRSDLFLDASRCFVAQTSVSLRGMRFIALFFDWHSVWNRSSGSGSPEQEEDYATTLGHSILLLWFSCIANSWILLSVSVSLSFAS